MRLATSRVSGPLGVCSALVLVFVFMVAATTSADETGQCVAVFKASSGGPVDARAPQVGHDARTNATYFFSITKDRAIRLTLQAGDLQADKTVYADGRFRLQIKDGNDHVVVVLAPGQVEVQRRGRHVRIDTQTASEADWLEVRALLVASRPLRLFRSLTANLDPATLEGPAGPGLLLGDAAIGFVDGDVGAIARLAGQMRAARQARVRLATFRQEGPEFLKCFRMYQEAVDVAWNEYADCLLHAPWWDPSGNLCSLEWILKVESAWFQFLACSAVPMRADG